MGNIPVAPLPKEGSVKENANACDRELMCDVACVRACVCICRWQVGIILHNCTANADHSRL